MEENLESKMQCPNQEVRNDIEAKQLILICKLTDPDKQLCEYQGDSRLIEVGSGYNLYKRVCNYSGGRK